MKTVLLHLLTVSVPICIFGMAAWLIYTQSKGWGWFLFVAFLILCNLKISAK